MRKDDFPELDTVYLDSACMSLRPYQVIEKVKEYYNKYPACPGRSNHSLSSKANEELESARAKVASFIDADPENVVFTSGNTEGINIVANSFKTDKVLISDREHNSNLIPWQEKDLDIEVIDTKDGFNLEKLRNEVGKGDLVSVVHVSNLDGYELPVKEIVEISRKNGAYTLVDAAQSIPHQNFSVKQIKPDFVAFSGHKMMGPSGTGALYVSDRVKDKIEPSNMGGGAVKNSTYTSSESEEFPHNMEAGLPNMAGFIGLGAAVEYIQEIGIETIEKHEKKLTEMLRSGLESIENVEIVGKKGVGVVSFRIEGIDSHQASLMLDQRDIAVRSGMHCLHSWFNDRDEKPSIRASLYIYNDEEDIEKILEAVRTISKLS